MNLKIVTLLILWILVINGQIFNDESNINENCTLDRFSICTTFEYKSHTDDYDITTTCKTTSVTNAGNVFNTTNDLRCYDIKIHLRTNAVGMPVTFNGLILTSEKKSLEFIADYTKYPKLLNNIFTQNQIEYNTTGWTTSTLSMSNNAIHPKKFNYDLFLWKANTIEESFQINWKQRNSIKMCISISYLLEDESQCTLSMELSVLNRDNIFDKRIISVNNIKESKELTTVLIKSEYWLLENETYSLNFKLQRKSSEKKIRNERYYNSYSYNPYYTYKTVYAENCKIGIKRISQCTDDNGNEHEEILTINEKDFQEIFRYTSLTADVYPFEYEPLKLIELTPLTLECLNGGFKDKYYKLCICPPGFKGNNCEHGCGPNKFGADCTGMCSMYQTQCQQMMICTKGFGCKCPAGYSGEECNKECTSGTYGVNCEQLCPEGCRFNSCNVYTGVCDKGCSTNYIAPDCKEKYPWLKSPPELESSDFKSLKLIIYKYPMLGSYSYLSDYYQIVYKIASNESEFQYSEIKEIDSVSVIEIINLKPGTLYTFGVILVSEDGNYNIEDIETVNYSTKCLLPRYTNYDVKLLSGTEYINVTWNKLNDQKEGDCKITKYLLNLMYDNTDLQQLNSSEVDFDNSHGYIFENLLPGVRYAVQVIAITAEGQANASSLSYIYTESYKYLWLKSPPQLESSDFKSLKLKIDLNSENIKGRSNINHEYYQILYKDALNKSKFQYMKRKKIREKKSVVETIHNLNPGTWYTIGVILTLEDGNYDIQNIKTVNYSTKCIISNITNYDVNLLSGTDYIKVTWNKLSDQNEKDCKITEYLLKLIFNKQQSYSEVKSNNNHGYIFENLLPGERYAVQVTAITATGQANPSNLSYIYTEPYGYIQIKNIKTELNQNSSIIITWDVDESQANLPLSYEIKYKVNKHLSCSTKILTNNWTSMLVYNQTKKEITDLIPNTQYVIKVNPEIKGYTYDDNANIIFIKTPISEPNLTPVISENNSWYITNQSAYFNWKINSAECSKLNGFFRGYQIILKDILEETQEEKSIEENWVSFDELIPDTMYELQVYILTNYGYNLEQGLVIPFKTKNKFLEPVDELIVYKKNLKHKSIGIRWSFNNTEVINSFIVIAIDETLNSTKQIIVEPDSCVAWPAFYCTTIDNLIPNNQYTIKIKAKSLDYPKGGLEASVITKLDDGFADKPENLRTTNVGPTYISLEWDIPWIHNGVLKSFIVNIEEISSQDIEKCCESKPDVEIPITEELPSYNCTINDLKPGSTYSIGVLSKTSSYGQTSKIHVTTLSAVGDIKHEQAIQLEENTTSDQSYESTTENIIYDT